MPLPTKPWVPSFCAIALVGCIGCTTHADPPSPELAVASAPPSTPSTHPPTPFARPPSQFTPPTIGDPQLAWTTAKCDAPPVSLTASDGSGLTLTRFQANAVVHGPLAFTELHLVFHNPEPRELEGRFSVTLPDDAAISRLAMQIDGHWQEGEVVEKQAARIAYEDFLHRKQDPALMERALGNVYDARVFPIPASGDKHLIVSYSQELGGTEPYRLPLCGLPEIAELDVDVRLARFENGAQGGEQGAWLERRLELHERGATPSGDVEVSNLGAQRAYGVRSGDLAIASITPTIAATQTAISRAVILFDTSASRANDFAGQVARLGELARALAAAHPGLELEVLAFDQDVASVFAGPARDFGPDAEAKLIERGPLGASAFDVALDAVARSPQVPERLILISDGMLTAGAELGALGERLHQLETDGLRRLDVIVDGNSADLPALTRLARGELPEHGVVLRGSTPLPELVERLSAGTQSGLAVAVDGATWVWPTQLDGVQPGDAALIYAQLGPDADPNQPLRVTIGGQAHTVPTLAAPEPLLARAQARASIAAHEAALLGELTPEQAAATRASVVELSVRHRVLSDQTALLVLETEADYQQFGIARTALVDILTIGDQGLETLRRGAPLLARGRAPRPAASDDLLKSKASSAADFDPTDATSEGVMGGVIGYGSGSASGYGASASHAAPRIALAGAAADDSHEDAAKRAEASNAEERPSPELDQPASEPAPTPEPEPAPTPEPARPPADPAPRANAHTGRYAAITRMLARQQLAEAESDARAWVREAPGDVLALVALGDALAASDDHDQAARAYGSLIDLYPARADIRRMAGARLEALDEAGLTLAEDSYRRAIEQRPDHPSGYRLLAWVLVKRGDVEQAFDVLERGLDRDYPEDRYLGVKTVLRQDLGIVAAIWLAREPARAAELKSRTAKLYTTINNRYSLRFVLNWETDANDVDLHIWDDEGGHAFYGASSLASGGDLVADVTTGFGPEAFVIHGRNSAKPYTLMAHYYSRGAMGYGMGKLQVLEHDGEGNVAFTEHPFVVMKDDAWVDLTVVRKSLL